MGIPPTHSIAYETIESNRVACVGGVALVAALDANTQMTNAFIEAVAKLNPGAAVFRDDTFRNNNALRISLEQTFKQLSNSSISAETYLFMVINSFGGHYPISSHFFDE